MAALSSAHYTHKCFASGELALASHHCTSSSSSLLFKVPQQLAITSVSPLRPLRRLNLIVSSVVMEKSLEAVKHSPSKEILEFVKYQGLGNDFLLVDNRDSIEPKISPEQAVKLCNRNFGVGADGVIFAMPGIDGSDYSMRILNSDGSEPEMCGNGIRCMARFVAELEKTTETKSYTIHTLAGLIIPKLRDDGQVDDVLMGILCIYAPVKPHKKAWLWGQIVDALPAVDTRIVGEDFNNVVIAEDWRVDEPPVLPHIAQSERDAPDAILFAFSGLDAWHIPSLSHTSHSLDYSWGYQR
ncbi:hypothetical protein L7F22_024857 [Adiantum nelumboides]|nr:hypothetical protein [Adiantum nelumboides]